MSMPMSESVFLVDAQATNEAGKALGKLIQEQDAFADRACVIFLNGVLGAGKTSFCGGVLAGFGHSGPVKSPTYTLVEPYEFESSAVHHFDLYRLGHPEELDYMGIRDYFSAKVLALIEWPERGEGFLPEADLIVSLSPSGKGRNLQLSAPSPVGESVLGNWHMAITKLLKDVKS